jgi:hypothetical protein
MMFDEESFTFLHFLLSVLGDDRQEEAIVSGLPSRTVSDSLPSGKTPWGSPLCAGMEDFCHPQSQKAVRGIILHTQKRHKGKIVHLGEHDFKSLPCVQTAHGSALYTHRLHGPFG